LDDECLYTSEDLIVLKGMVDAIHFRYKHDGLTFWQDNTNALRLFLEKEIKERFTQSVLDRFIQLFIQETPMVYIENIIYKESLENMPLYINDPTCLGLIAQW